MSVVGATVEAHSSKPELDWLFDFQLEDVERLVGQRAVLIGNEMGTGKTYEAIALDLLRRWDWFNGSDLGPDLKHTAAQRATPKTLIIAPLSVIGSWDDHYEELAPQLKRSVVDPKARAQFLKDLKDPSVEIYICHWDVLRIIQEELRAVQFLHIIADEAHRAKNRKAQQTRALKSLRGTYRTALTGTPVMNQPQDLWSILNWLHPFQWRSYWKFYERYVDYEIQYPQQFRKVVGPKNEGELKTLMAPFFARRRKMDVLKDLPPKYYTTIWVDLEPKQRRAYDQMKKEMIAWLEHQDQTKPLIAPVVIAQLIRLQQLAAAYVDIDYDEEGSHASLSEPSSKLTALMEMINDNPGEPIVIYSQFKQLIRLLEHRLQKSGLGYVRITGDDSETERRNAIRTFQAGGADYFLGTIGAGSEGITLTRASTVVFLDRDWTPARNAQAEDRLHRIGQEEAVQVIDIMARDTVDLGRRQKLELKKEWIRRLID